MQSHVAVGLSVVVLASAIGFVVVDIPVSTPSGSGDEPLGEVHCRGVTGEGITVGIVSTTGFDTSKPALATRTTATRSFGGGTDRKGDHGTASATVVARTAPDADLLLAAADSPRTYRNAVTWLLDENADVVLVPASFLGTAGRSQDLGQLAEREGAVLIAPTGNLAKGHWRGEFDLDGQNTSRLRFREEPNGTRLRVRGNTSEFSLWLSWNGASSTAFEASLYRETDGDPELVARSEPYTDNTVPNQLLSATISSGNYFVVVEGAQSAVGTTVTVRSPTHELVGTTLRGSITSPAADPSVLAVGGYDTRTNETAGFSGRGPTSRGTLGVDVVAPKRQAVSGEDRPFVGTSAAASWTAGIAALLLDAEPELEAREVEVVLERTARPIGPPGPDPTSGYGRVSPVDALESVGELSAGDGKTTTEPMNNSMRSPTGFRSCPS